MTEDSGQVAVQEALKAEEVAHSSLGASSAERWMNCTASPQLTAKLPEEDRRKAGYAADEGTAAHEIAARCLKEDREPWEFIGYEVIVGTRSFTCDDEMAEAVQVHINTVYDVMRRYAEYDPLLKVEQPLYSKAHEKAFGTADVVIVIEKIGLLIIMDYKHGIGVTAEPDKPQTKIYASLALERVEDWGVSWTDLEHVHLYIVQPRHPHPKGIVRRYETTPHELWDFFENEVLVAMKETESPHAVLKVGDWCRFCPARTHCPALKQATEEMDPTLEPIYLTDEELGSILKNTDQIKSYIDALEKEAFARVKKGQKIPGRKLVRKQSSRIWKSGAEEALKETFGDTAYEPAKLKTPPAIEKLKGGSALVTKYAYKPDSGLTLAPEGDRRSEVTLTPEEIFGTDSVEF